MPHKLTISTTLIVGLAIFVFARSVAPTSAELRSGVAEPGAVGSLSIGLAASGACPAVSGATHPVISGPLVVTGPGLYNGDGQTIVGGDNNIDIEASDVTVCNYILQGAQGASVNIDAFNHITLGALNIHDYNQSGAGGDTSGGPQYVGGVACWYCAGLTVIDSTIASTKYYGNGIWVKRTNAGEAGPDYFARNTIIGGWDGIGSEPEGDPDGGLGTGTIIENNIVSGCHDDGIQVEGRDENIIVRNNTVSGCGAGIATAAALVGPVHIENNYIHDLVLAPSTAFFCFKLGASQGASTPEIDYTGNTCISPGAGGFEQTNSGLNFKIVATHNCIQDGLYVIDFNEQPGQGTLFDYDTLLTSDSSGRFAKWSGQRYDLAGLRGLGQELHGVQSQVCPSAVSTPTLTLSPTVSAARPSPTPTRTPVLAYTPSPTASRSPTATPSGTATPTDTLPPSSTPSRMGKSLTPTPTHTHTSFPISTPTSTLTPAPTPNVRSSVAPRLTAHWSATPSPTPRSMRTERPVLQPPSAPTKTSPSPTATPSETGEAVPIAKTSPSSTMAPVRGDADCNGRIDTLDAIRLLEVVGQMDHRETSGCASDLDANCDGRVDSRDALAMLRALAGDWSHQAVVCG